MIRHEFTEISLFFLTESCNKPKKTLTGLKHSASVFLHGTALWIAYVHIPTFSPSPLSLYIHICTQRTKTLDRQQENCSYEIN